MNSSNILNWILWMPMIGVLGCLFIPKGKDNAVRWWALINTTVTFVITMVLYKWFDPTVVDMQESVFTVSIPWISQFNINYALGVDGISVPMIILTSLLCLLCVGCSWTITKQVKAYFALFLFLQSTVFGVFMALDFFLFYVYWEVMLIPMFFLIGIWGGENREKEEIQCHSLFGP